MSSYAPFTMECSLGFVKCVCAVSSGPATWSKASLCQAPEESPSSVWSGLPSSAEGFVTRLTFKRSYVSSEGVEIFANSGFYVLGTIEFSVVMFTSGLPSGVFSTPLSGVGFVSAGYSCYSFTGSQVVIIFPVYLTPVVRDTFFFF